MEEEYIQQICEDIIRLKPDLIFTEKGISGTQNLQFTFIECKMLLVTLKALLLNIFPP